MEPVELIVAALAAGAAGGAENVASTVVKDAYQELKRLVTARFAGSKTAKVALADHEADPEAGRASLEQALTDSGAAADAELIDAARRLLAILSKSSSAGGKCTVTVENSQGTHVGDFGSKPPSGPAEVDDGVPVRERREPQDGRVSSAEVDDGVPVRERREPRERTSYSSRVPTGISGPDRVILIERSRGVQVGRDNDQFSVYQVTLPSTAFRSGHALANRLMSPDTPWSRDLFKHDARPDFGRATGGTSSYSSGGVIQGPRGDTLVIVRNSSGVQIGDHGTQRNEFRIRVSDVTVRADGLAMNRERQGRIARLRENPRDQAAARWLARDVGRVAQDALRADITARVKAVVDRPQINRWSGRVYGRMGAQVGGPHNRVRQEIDVVVSRFDTRALERQILNRAARLPRSPTIRNERRDSRHSAGEDRETREPDFWNTRGSRGGRGSSR